jgi:tellurite resistance-related uncharacterized protein
MTVARRIVAIEADEDGSWILSLDCGHRRHARHRPPLSSFPWLNEPAERAARIGQTIECEKCLLLELPGGAMAHRTTETWDERSMPASLRRDHTLRAGTWGRIEVLAGRLRYTVGAPIGREIVIEAGGSALIPPEIGHSVEPLGSVRFRVVFLRVA